MKKRRRIEEDEEEELTCTSDSPAGQRQEEVENRRDFVTLLCNRRLLHHSILPLRRKLTSVLGCPPPHRLCVWVCSIVPASLFFSVWLKRGSGLLMRFLRHAVQGFSSAAAADERRVCRPARPPMLRERAESAVDVGRFLSVLSRFSADTHTHTQCLLCVRGVKV